MPMPANTLLIFEVTFKTDFETLAVNVAATDGPEARAIACEHFGLDTSTTAQTKYLMGAIVAATQPELAGAIPPPTEPPIELIDLDNSWTHYEFEVEYVEKATGHKIGRTVIVQRFQVNSSLDAPVELGRNDAASTACRQFEAIADPTKPINITYWARK